MQTTVTGERGGGNRLLAALKPQDYERLKPHLQDVPMAQHQVLYEPGKPITRAYFPHDGFVSLVTAADEGPGIETATVGAEGVIGLPLLVTQMLSPSQAIVQVSGAAATMPVEPLQHALTESASMRALFGNYIHAFLGQVYQAVACNALHSAEERLAKWLLMSSDRTKGNGVPLTHEFLAEMLGVGRPTVSLIARTLQNAGLITYRRGLITVLDRPGLEETSCSCYDIVRRSFEQLLPLTFTGSTGKA